MGSTRTLHEQPWILVAIVIFVIKGCSILAWSTPARAQQTGGSFDIAIKDASGAHPPHSRVIIESAEASMRLDPPTDDPISAPAQPGDAKKAVSVSTVTRHEVQSFWNDTLKEAAKEPLDAKVELLSLPVPFKKYRVTYRSLGGVMVRAYLAVPITGESAGPKRFPAIVTTVGYSGVFPSEMIEDCRRGYAILEVFPRSQGDSQELWKIDGPDKLTWHISAPNGYYYQGAYIDVLRGVDFLATRPEVDVERIGFLGTSQAGGIGLAVAALDPRIRAVAVALPFLCDMRRAAAIHGSIVNTLLEKYGVLNPQSLRTLEFFDPLNLVEHLQRPVLMSAGGKDTGVPAETIRAVYERLPGLKGLIFYPDLAHAPCMDFEEMSWEWMDRYLRR